MLNELISRANLEEMAGATAFQRGETYFAEGAVGLLRATDDKLTARVEGSEIYQVELWGDDDELAYDCTCPRAADGYFCKHCVAVGLAWPGLAGKLASSRPNDAISLYRRVVPAIIEQTNNSAYAEATKLIGKVGSLMAAQNQSQEFADYLPALRRQFKPKRNFIKLLDGLMA